MILSALDGNETITGPISIIPSAAIPAATQSSSLLVQASPFSVATDTQNYISRVLDLKNNEGSTFFLARHSDAVNLPITGGKKTSITVSAAEMTVSPSLAQLTNTEFPTDGMIAGFKITGRQKDGSATFDPVLDVTYYDAAATQINYYGDINNNNSLVTKTYVDTAISNAGSGDALPLTGGTMTGQIKFTMGSGDPININSGNFKIGNNGAVNMKSGFTLADGNIAVNAGNITAKQGAANAAGDLPSNGRLYTKTNDGTTNFTAFPSGSINVGSTIAFTTSAANKTFYWL